MASRRLDISSLLCHDDVPDLNVGAPHLRNKAVPPFPRDTFPSTSPPSPPPTFYPPYPRPLAPPPSPPSNPYPQLPRPQASPRQPPPPVPLSQPKPYVGLDALVHAATEERRRLSGSTASESDFSTRPSPINSPHVSQQFHPLRHGRLQHPDDMRSPIQQYSMLRHSPNITPLQTVLSPLPSVHSPGYSPLLSQRRRMSHEESNVRLSPIDSPQRLSAQPPLVSPVHLSFQHAEQEKHRQLELDRQRQHHDRVLPQERQQQHHFRDRHPHIERPVSLSPSAPLPLEGSPQTQAFSSPNPAFPLHGRKPGQGLPHHTVPILNPVPLPPTYQLSYSPAQMDSSIPSPSKKRRYSNSPTRPAYDEEERLQHERERMVPGDLGYGRMDASTPSSLAPTNEVKGRKHLGLADLVTPNTERDWLRPPTTTMIVSPSREVRDLPSPIGRRSPPGSQIGRAWAAKKSEDSRSLVQEQPLQPRLGQGPATTEKTEERGDKISHLLRQPSPSSAHVQDEEDAHEWFLEHYGDDAASRSGRPQECPPSTTPICPSTIPSVPVREIPAPKKRSPSPIVVPKEAAVAFEQELEDLVTSASTQPTKLEQEADIDMEVDLAVTELVAKTLEADDPKAEDMAMEVDVDDELLSLVDDWPRNRRTSNHVSISAKLAVSRPSTADGSALVQPSLSGTTPTTSRQTPFKAVSEEGGSRLSPHPALSSKDKDKEVKKGEKNSGSTTGTETPKRGMEEFKPMKSKTVNGNAIKSRAKGGPKTKPKTDDSATPPPIARQRPTVGSAKKAAASRSRSTSVIPGGGSVGPQAYEGNSEKQEEEEGPEEDHKLYCFCKTKYDEDRFMIACDRCDEWYHTQCLNMPDLEVELVDQFICSPCIDKSPHLELRTTYKPRCLFGLKHPDPSSLEACHRPARGAFSKYCSDECGVKYMRCRVDAWAKKGGKKELLWESVKTAQKREGLVIQEPQIAKEPVDGDLNEHKDKVQAPKRTKADMDVERLNGLLDSVVAIREQVKAGLECVVWREKLLELATERGEQAGQCGWDQRLCFGEQEWAELGPGVLESYTSGSAASNGEGEGEWWCTGKKVCDRHAGWQNIRYKDVCNEKEKKEDALQNLTTREREIRKRIADVLSPHGRACNEASTKSPLKLSNAKLNGHAKGKVNGDAKKSKKRKALS